jgi:uncharacterized protein YndB with AHSA1/START domain
MVFPSKEARDRVVRDYGAIEGGRQTLERAAEYTAGMLTAPFVITREFAAPLDLVWSAWTEARHFGRWFGPKGVKVDLVKFELQPGGLTHYSMTTPDGKVMWGRAVYREVVTSTKLVWINSFSDAAGGITRHPLSRDPWPLEMLTTVTFAGQGGRTTVTIHWLPFDATAAERATFEAGRGSMTMGWTGTLDQLTTYLASNP